MGSQNTCLQRLSQNPIRNLRALGPIFAQKGPILDHTLDPILEGFLE